MEFKGIKIKKRKDGYWFFRVKNKTTGKYNYYYNKNQAALYKELKSIFASLDLNINIKLGKTLQQWIDEYFALYKIGIIKESSLKEIKNEFKHLKPLLNKQISKITALEIKDIIYNMTAKRQAQKLYVHTKELFSKAVTNNVIKKNPVLEIKKPEYIKLNESKAFTVEQQAVIENRLLRDKEYAILFCLYQGTRIGETLALKFKSIENGIVNIHYTINVHRNLQSNNLERPKTKTSFRSLPIFERTENLLSMIKAGKKEEYIFDTTYQHCQNYFQNMMQELKMKGFTLHSTRHTFATRALEKGVNIRTISMWLGHYSSDITNKVYLHINKDFERSEIDKINS